MIHKRLTDLKHNLITLNITLLPAANADNRVIAYKLLAEPSAEPGKNTVVNNNEVVR